MRRYAPLLLAALCGLSLATGLFAAQPAPTDAPQVPTRLERVALFKNGLGYFVRRGELPASPTSLLLGPFAAPVHGTFWVSTPASAGLESLITRQVRLKGATIEAANTAELLRANVGRQVTVWTEQDGKTPISGTILSFAPDRPYVIQPERTYQMGVTSNPSNYGAPNIFPPFGRGEYVLLSTPQGIVSINPYSVVRAIFGSNPADVATRFQADAPGAELVATVHSPRPGDWIGINYLAKGITWAPSYQVDISDPKTARLSASALIVNEAEDLADTHVDLITGFPNIQFQDVLSPIGEKTDLAGFLQQLTGGGYRAPAGVTANVMSQVATFRNVAENAPTPEYGVPQLGQQTEDLFFYPVEHVNLHAGETGYYPLFTISVPYTQVYQWAIPDYVTQDYHYIYAYGQSPGATDTREIVWHSIRLTNTSHVPWTTAPAETVKNGQILGQDTLNYTPPKAQETVRITQAINVRAEQQELETKRELEALRRYGVTFDRVTLQGTLRVTNYKADAVTMEVKKTLQGEVVATAPQAKMRTLPTGTGRINQVRELTWEFPLASGQSQQITYTYTVLIAR